MNIDSGFATVRDLVDDGATAEDAYPRFMFHFTPQLDSGACLASDSSFEWAFTQSIIGFSSLPLPPPSVGVLNLFTWPDAIDHKGTNQGWIDVGYVLHLLEDLTSPAHTRNDCHPKGEFVRDDPDPYEEWGNGREIPLPPPSSFLQTGTPEQVFARLWRYTRNNFFSSDTVFVYPEPDFAGPVATSEDEDYFYDANGRKIAYKTAAYRRSVPKDRRLSTLDSAIIRKQFDELAPLTVLYAASLLCKYAGIAGAPSCEIQNNPPIPGFTMSAGAESATEGQTLNVIAPPGGTVSVSFSAERSIDHDGDIEGWEWALDGMVASTASSFDAVLDIGLHTVRLVITDNVGARSEPVEGWTAVQTPQTFTIPSTDVPKNIPDPGQVVSTITVPALGTILDVTASFSFTHQCERDLVMVVRHPDGSANTVMDRGLERCSGVDQTFTSTSLTMQNMLGKPTAGVWTLTITDDSAGFTGHLNSWSLNFRTTTAPSTNLANTGTVPEGVIDPNYILLSGPTCPAGNCPVYAAVMDGFPFDVFWPANTATSKWIEPVGGTADDHPTGQYVYRLTFQISGVDPATVAIAGRWASDNAAIDILVNGVSTGFTTGQDFQFSTFSIAGGFRLGLNTLDFVVVNEFNCPGCLNPTGLRVEFTSVPASALDDDFNDNSLDSAKWESFASIPGSTVAEVNQRLEIFLAAGGPGGAGIISRCSLGGDFDVQVDYALINWPPMNLYGLSFGAFELGGSIFRNSSTVSSLEFYTVVAGGSAAQVPTTHTSGKLRLVRNGSTLSGLFLSGSTWTQVGSGNVNTGTTRFTLGVGPAASAPGGIQVAFDTFTVNAGAVSCPPPSSIDDNFNDNSLNASLWRPYADPNANAGTVVETNQRLEVILNPGVANVGVRTVCSLAGDFDVQVDFLLLNWSSDNHQSLSLGAVDLGQGVFGGFRVERFSESGGDFYHMMFPNAIGPFVSTSDTSGTLRLVRTGSTLQGYYRDAANFILLASVPVSTSQTRFFLNGGSFVDDALAASFAFDNFTVNAGAVSCPP